MNQSANTQKQNVARAKPQQQNLAQPQRRRRRRRRDRVGRGLLTEVPVGTSRLVRMQQPRLSSSYSKGKAVTTIHHREYLADIAGSVGFQANLFPINPGMVITFPWLSTIANNWDSYLFRRLEFSYETACSSATPGSVMMSIDFDAADPTPTSKLQLMTYDNAVRSASWQEACYDATLLNLHKFGTQRFTRAAPLAANLDIKTYDVGNLFIATSGQADGNPIGELYVEYTVDLFTPQISPTSAGVIGNPARIVSDDGQSPIAIFGAAAVVTGSSVTATGSTITFLEPGQYLLSLKLTGTGLSGEMTEPTGLGVVATPRSDIIQSTTQRIAEYTLNVVAIGATLTWSAITATSLGNTDARLATYFYAYG